MCCRSNNSSWKPSLVPSCTKRLNLCKILHIVFLCFRRCCWTVFSGHFWRKKRRKHEVGYTWRTLGGGGCGVLSNIKGTWSTCHVTKSSCYFPVCVPLTCIFYLLTHVRVIPWSSFFFFFFTVLYLSFVFLPASKVNRQMSPKTSVQVPSSLISNNLTSLSSSLALLWRLPLVSPLWKRCQNAEWVFLSGELEPVSEQQCGSSCSLGARFAIIGNYEGFIIVLQLHCLLHLVRWLLDGTVFQLGCPLFVCQASKTT